MHLLPVTFVHGRAFPEGVGDVLRSLARERKSGIQIVDPVAVRVLRQKKHCNNKHKTKMLSKFTSRNVRTGYDVIR